VQAHSVKLRGAMPQTLLQNNRAWVQRKLQEDPEFFTRLSTQQKPRFLWIGCSDSRVPANQIIGLAPGEVFVHRNVANVVVHTDLNCLSTIQFAVDVLKVEHIILCGHYGCSGVHAALNGTRIGLADNWLRHVQDVAEHHELYLGTVARDHRHDRLCELNVIHQVQNVCRSSVVQDAWAKGQVLTVHGWIYGLQDGLIRDLQATCASAPGVAQQLASAISRVQASAGNL
jgi:carbonic anhydrase